MSEGQHESRSEKERCSTELWEWWGGGMESRSGEKEQKIE